MDMKVISLFSDCLGDASKEHLKDAKLDGSPCFHTKTKKLEMRWALKEALSHDAYARMVHDLRIALHADVDLGLVYPEPSMDFSLLEPYAHDLIAVEKDFEPFRSLYPRVDDGNSLVFSTHSPEIATRLEKQAPELERRLKRLGFGFQVKGVYEERRLAEDAVPAAAVAAAPVSRPKSPAASEHGNGPSASKGQGGWRKKGKAEKVAIRDLEDGMSNVMIEGRIFMREIRELRGGRRLMEMYVSDDDDAMMCKSFEGRSLSVEDMESFHVGDYVQVTGSCGYDKYKRDNVFSISSIEPGRAPRVLDTAPEKRIELHVHSTFSEMDGVSPIEAYVQQAWDWGMSAVGLCDHNVVQAFPMAQHKVSALKSKDKAAKVKALKEKRKAAGEDENAPFTDEELGLRKFTMLYGCEMTMVDDEYKVVRNVRDQKLEDAEYVIFDLETTGLSSRLDKIIEFGAVKMKDGEIIDRKQMFINPKRQIPASITELTRIRQMDVDDAKPIEDVFDELVEFIGDAILIAHNASFDIGMLNAAARDLGRPEFSNPVIDTLPASRSMFDLRSYRLGAVCRHYGVPYDGEGAHRADYDAEVLSSVFLYMLRDWPSGATLQTLNELDSSSALRKNFGKHITVYAKNKAGLKELFELVTLSHTKYLKYNPNSTNVTGEPCIPRRVLAEYHSHGNLLFGSSCQNGEIFDLAHTRSEQELLDAVDFYDYLEVQPLPVYKNLLDLQTVHSVDELKQILGFILDAGKKKNIPVIASGDCHYVSPRLKRVRDIFINSKLAGNTRHPLFIRDPILRQRASSPDQPFLNTQQMLDAFDWIDEETRNQIVLENPKKIAEQCEELFPIKDRLYPPEMEGSDQKLRDICHETAIKTYGEPLPEPVAARLNRELDAIIGAGYYVVYYISHLLVKKSNEDGYLVGSRGSVGSSFVATMSGITEVNPLKPHYLCPKCKHLEWIEDPHIHSGFDLPDKLCPECGEKMKGDGQDIPFETFLGFEGDKVPDIDLNFSGEYQANAHAFTKTIFGEDHVFRAGTVGTVQEKTAYGYVKGYEEEMGLEATPFSEYKRTDLAQECAGVKRTTGQHPGGIVVVPLDMDVHDFTPVQYPANNPYAEWKTTHFDFHQIHDNILKFDILGHVDPTAMKMMERLTGIDVTTIPMNDPATMSIFSSCDALGVDTTRYREKTGAAGIPEFGTPFVRGILELTRPTTFAELVSISGLSHGTNVWLNNAKDLIDNGICTLRQVIGCRDDIMVDLIRYGLPSKASFTIMESVRKGKGLKPEWEELMHEHDVPEWYLDSCRKIKYMFPKAHAVAYVMMAVRIAWFKIHIPRAYYCQFFSIRATASDLSIMTSGLAAVQSKMHEIETIRQTKTRKLEKKEEDLYDTLELCNEMYMRGYRIAPLSITRSQATEYCFDPDDEKAIIPPFSAVDSLGENVARSIVAAREERPFISKEDLQRRTSLSKTLIERLDFLGALEGLDEHDQLTLF